MSEYLPKYVGVEKACEWLAKRAGGEWTFERLLECHLMPYFWLDWTDESAAIFGGRTEGMLVGLCYAGDAHRAMALGGDIQATMVVTDDEKLIRYEPGIPVPFKEIRFLREDLTRLASATQSLDSTDHLSAGVSVGIDVAGYDSPPELSVIREAIKEFWVDADRARPPKKDEILAWIRARVDTDAKANAIDLLIRPEWARVGGNKKWAKG